MIPGTLLDSVTAQTLDFAWLVKALAPASEYGRRVFAELAPFAPGEEDRASQRSSVIDALARAADVARLDAVRDALRAAPDASAAVARASMGDVLGDAALFELQRFCDAAGRVDSLLEGIAPAGAVTSDAVRETAAALENGRAGKFGFYLADGFDSSLRDARERAARLQAEFDAARGRAAESVARELGRDDVGSDEFIVMRADVRALPAGVRVVREAPTYYLCELEYDEATLAAMARRDEAIDAVASAEERVRARLSETVRLRAAELDRATRRLGETDVLVSAARFARTYECRPARIVRESAVRFQAGRFLPLADELESSGRHFTPIDVELHDVAVLTGPNMGGKSVCLRTCGLVVLCASFGLPVPASGAETALFDEVVWLGIGADEGGSGGLLSSFAREVVRLRDVMARPARKTFVLADEFARTTTPHEGKALLIALIEALRARGACGMVATHLGGIAGDAGARHFAVRGLRGIPDRPATADLSEALTALARSMDYTIAEVSSGEEAARADAIALAALLGLDGGLIDAAYRALK
jgi:DNA mismatch repair protein MutS2